MTDVTTIDIAGIGIGPFNLGLAALLDGHPEVSHLFLERKTEFRWHEGLLLPGTTLQVPFLADLVTMADPTHPLSYLNYLHHHDRLHAFYYYDNFQVPRLEYDHYCRWAAQRLGSCRFDEDVCDVTYDADTERFLIQSQSISGFKRHYRSRHLASAPNPCCRSGRRSRARRRSCIRRSSARARRSSPNADRSRSSAPDKAQRSAYWRCSTT
jgi:lysine N6-hydroxylase